MKNKEKDLIALYKDIYCFIISRVNDCEYAKDLTQSTMETAIKKYNTLRNKAALKSWVMQIANNKVNAYYNDLKRNKSVVVYPNYEEHEEFVNDIENLADLKANILDLIVTEEDKKNIMIALNRLEYKYQEVIRLNYICDYNFIEISEILNVNINTIRTWGARGIIKLKAEFDSISRGDRNEANKKC